MSENFDFVSAYPNILRYAQSSLNGVQSVSFPKHSICYIISGKKYLYYGNRRYEVGAGELFYLPSGQHYVENITENNRPFVQMMILYSTDQLGSIISQLNVNYGMVIAHRHECDKCSGKTFVSYPAWSAMKEYFNSLGQYMKDGMLLSDPIAERIKMTELIYMLLSNEECCINKQVLAHSDRQRENFEQVIRRNIFNDVSIEELAAQSNRSLTSFKKEFKSRFHESPHKWFIRQRLMHSRMLLISTGKSISEIGVECRFPNTSHFIKLFKKEFHYTPASYRNRHRGNDNSGSEHSAVTDAPVVNETEDRPKQTRTMAMQFAV
jgi:AraC-like DNA-binding protein